MSLFTSTTSLLLVVAFVGYELAALWLAYKGTISIDALKYPVETLLILYGVRKGIEAGKNGGPHVPAP